MIKILKFELKLLQSSFTLLLFYCYYRFMVYVCLIIYENIFWTINVYRPKEYIFLIVQPLVAKMSHKIHIPLS